MFFMQNVIFFDEKSSDENLFLAKRHFKLMAFTIFFYVKFVYPVYKKARADYNETVVKFMQSGGTFCDTELLFAKYK